MKKPLYKFAYRTVSRLSDLTGGLAFLVRWKVALAAIVLGFSAGTLVGCEPDDAIETCYLRVTCYDVSEPMCYAPVREPGTEEGEGDGSETAAGFGERDGQDAETTDELSE